MACIRGRVSGESSIIPGQTATRVNAPHSQAPKFQLEKKLYARGPFPLFLSPSWQTL